MAYKFTSGPFEGEVVEGHVLDASFSELDEDLQVRIREFGESKYPQEDPQADFPVDMDTLKQDYENSWDAEETDENPTLLPYSNW